MPRQVADGKLRTEGQRRGTKYFVGGGKAAAKATGHKPKFTLVTDKGDYIGPISAASPLANRQIADIEREAD